MTNEAAIAELKRLDNIVNNNYSEAIYLAIKALEEVEKHKETFDWCTDCKEYDQEAHCCHRWTKCIRDTVAELKEQTYKDGYEHGYTQAENNQAWDEKVDTHEGDLIPRTSVLQIIRNASAYWGGHQEILIPKYDVLDAIKHLPSSTPQPKRDCDTCKHSAEQDGSNCYECIKNIRNNYETCEGDLISREDAINYLMINMGWHDEDGYPVDDWDEKKSCISDLINGVPSVTPQQKMGKWIDGYCSECGKSCLCDGWGIDIESKFCPNCGAEMEVNNADSD